MLRLLREVIPTIAKGDPKAFSRLREGMQQIGKIGKKSTVKAIKETAGGLFEKSVKKTFRKKIIRENEILRDAAGKVIGEIDFETAEAIVEIGISLKGKIAQLQKLAAIAAKRGKRLDVIYKLDISPARLKFLKDSLRKKWGNRVRFIPHG